MRLANGAKETTTTTGTGTVTLSAVTGYPRFSDILGVGTLVDYAIRSGDSWEWGIGTLAAGNTLERSIISAKYESGVYSKNPASGVSLSGTSDVFCTAHSATISPTLHTHPQRGLGYITKNVFNGAPANYRARIAVAQAANQVWLIPYLIEMRCKVTKIGVQAGGSVAGASCRVGMYGMNADGSPGKLLFASGLLEPVSSGTVYMSTVSDYDLLPGWYWMCLHTGATGPNLQSIDTGNGPQSVVGTTSGTITSGIQFWFRAGVTLDVLPEDASSFGVTQAQTRGNEARQPCIYLEVA